LFFYFHYFCSFFAAARECCCARKCTATEGGGSQPTLEVIRKLAIALSVSADVLIFDEGERGPEDSLKFQLETIARFDEEDKRVAQAVLERLILKSQAKQSLQRQVSK